MDISMQCLLNEIDTTAHEKILKLDKRLKDLQAEIALTQHEAGNEHLSHLLQDIEQALKAIMPVVTVVNRVET